MKKFLVGWSFDKNAPPVNWCDKRAIEAITARLACEWYCEHCSLVPRSNSLAIVHCQEYGESNG